MNHPLIGDEPFNQPPKFIIVGMVPTKERCRPVKYQKTIAISYTNEQAYNVTEGMKDYMIYEVGPALRNDEFEASRQDRKNSDQMEKDRAEYERLKKIFEP